MTLISRLLALGLVTAALVTPVWSQTTAPSTPFDMTPESDLQVKPVTPPVTPLIPEAAPVAPLISAFSRQIVPFDQMQLVGEDASRAVVVYLTEAQAAAPATLELGYLNAIVAAPEASTLETLINGTSIIRSPIASSAETGILVAEIPAGLLRAGPNVIEFRAVQRHRTDCSIASTYELWAQIDPVATVLRFEGQNLDRIVALGDIAAVGFDATATTTVRIIVPELQNPEVASAALELVQHVALALHVPHISVEIVSELPAETPVGTLNVVLASASALPAAVDIMRQQAGTGPLAAFAPAPIAANTLVVSGPEWSSISTAISAISAASTPAAPDLLLQRVDLAYPIPLLTGSSSIKLADLGVRTVEFNGRRFRTSFEFALPADFYASMYGQAQLVLDAAYSDAVLPGSELDIYANGRIASATPVLRTDSGRSRSTLIKIPMTNFRPGRNEIEIEVILQATEDVGCAPGLTQNAAGRFIFSSSSQFNMPDFGRALVLPDLQSFSGTGAPYGGQTTPVLLGSGENVLPSAMTWLARIAIASGAVIPVAKADEATLDPKANALVVSPLATLSDGMLNRSGVARTVSAGAAAPDDAAILNRFNQSAGASSSNPLDNFRNWVAERVGLAPENFWLIRPQDGAYLPQSADAVIVAQNVQPEGGTWTYLTIPDDAALAAGVQRLTETTNWRAIKGRVSALGPNDPAVLSVQSNGQKLVQTQPFSLLNLRLVAANWLSTNVLEFTALLALVTLVLTFATAALLKALGRRS